MIEKVETVVGGKTIAIETGRLAKQAGGSVVVSCGDTMVMVNATMSSKPRENVDFFPLMVDYEERKYAVGKIPGGFVKRGGRPSEKAIITSRLIDRPIRPLFPEGLRNEVQVIAVPLSAESENPADTLAIIGASAALTISEIPFEGPVGAVRVARIDGEWLLNPSLENIELSDIDLVVVATKETVMTLELESKQISESDLLAAIDFAWQPIQEIIALQEELQKIAGKEKAEVKLFKLDEEIYQAVKETAQDEIVEAIQSPDKVSRETGMQEVKEAVAERLAERFPERESEIMECVDKLVKQEVRRLALEKGVRVDGRAFDEIRPITCEVGLLPRVHGSAIFTRGQTQVLATLTLGSLEDSQIVDTLEEDGEKRFMHFYNFPPYSVGEVRPLRAANRREIGHGMLAERSVRPVVPPQEDFPYTILVTSEVLESNASSSMASACACSLCLMDGGVKIEAPVGGISMGLITGEGKSILLTDIQGIEDFYGDMDFKIAGTRKGITATQLDTKIKGLTREQIADALEGAKVARMKILDAMEAALPAPRENISPYAPRVFIVEIHPDKIGDIIGPGGKVVKKIEADTGAKLAIEQDGRVYITSVDEEGGLQIGKMVEDITREVRIGEVYPGIVTRTESYGAFVEILPNKEGLVHISRLSMGRVSRTEDVVHVGEEILVKVIEIKEDGKIGLAAAGLRDQDEISGMPADSRIGSRDRSRDDRFRSERRFADKHGRDEPGDGLPGARFRPKK